MPAPSQQPSHEASRIARQQGAGFCPAPCDLGLEVYGDDGLVELLRPLPRDPTIVVLSRWSSTLHAAGETASETQRILIDRLLTGDVHRSAQRWMSDYPNGVIFTYEAIVRLSLFVMAFADPTLDRALEPTELDCLAYVLPELQARLTRFLDATGTPRPDTVDRDEAAFTLFLVGNAPGRSTSSRNDLVTLALGTLAATKTCTQLEKKSGRAVRQALQTVFRADIAEIHSAAVNLVTPFLRAPAGSQPNHLFLADASDNRLGEVVARLAHLGAASPPQDAMTASLFGPKSVLPEGFRDRPFLQIDGGPTYACWDVRQLYRMLGGRFPQWLRPAFDGYGGAFDMLSSTWDVAVEDAFDELVGGLLPSWRKPPVNVKGVKNCDRCFEVGDHLFMVEVKNIRPSEALARGSARQFREWLHSKFFVKDGFPQIDATLAAMDRTGRKPFVVRKLRQYKSIWPVVVCWTTVPGHPGVASLLHQLQQQRHRGLDASLLERVRPPLVLGYHDFISTVATAPSLAALDLSLGDVFEGYVGNAGHRALLLSTFAQSLVGSRGFTTEVTSVLEQALLRHAWVGLQLREQRV